MAPGKPDIRARALDSATDILGRIPWRSLRTPPLPAVANMAIDEVLLLRSTESGEGVLRIYTWEPPALSLGRNQSARGTFSPERARLLGLDIVRRLTGGRAIVHRREVTYSVSAPAVDDEPIAPWYAAINALLVRALAIIGVDASLALPAGRMPPPASAPCFELPAAGEIVWEGRKLVGSAQVREKGGLLQHGSLLIADDQPLLSRIALNSVASMPPAATLTEALGEAPSLDDVAASLIAALEALAGTSARALDVADLDPALLARAEQRYSSERWTWKS